MMALTKSYCSILQPFSLIVHRVRIQVINLQLVGKVRKHTLPVHYVIHPSSIELHESGVLSSFFKGIHPWYALSVHSLLNSSDLLYGWAVLSVDPRPNLRNEIKVAMKVCQ